MGTRRRGDLIRFVPYPVVGGFLAGTGWLLVRGGLFVASRVSSYFTPLSDLLETSASRLLPALAFGVILLVSVRVVKRPLVIPAVIAIGLVVFVAGMVATGSSIEELREVDGCSDRSRRAGCGSSRGRSARSAAPTGSPCSSRGPGS